MVRNISQNFLNDLQNGKLTTILRQVTSDDTLNLELRGNSIIIYYRGGKLLEIKEDSLNRYTFISGDNNYNKKSNLDYPSPSIDNINEYIYKFKHIIDLYFGGIRVDKNKEEKETVRFSLENEIRQHIVRENNYTTTAEETDFFIIDTEYVTKNGKKFDIVAIEWEAVSVSRKLQKGYLPKLYIIELKYAGGSISGKCGLSGHLRDFKEFNNNQDEVETFRNELLLVFKQKRELGLIPYLKSVNKNEIKQFAEGVTFINIIANFKKASSVLKSEIETMDIFDMIIANFMGYGLYKHGIRNKDEVINLLEIDICI